MNELWQYAGRWLRLPTASPPEAVLAHIAPGADVIVPLANGEPRTLIDALDAHARELTHVRVHQMHTLHDHPYLHGAYGDHLRHVSYFLSPVTRSAFAEGDCDLVPVNFSEMPLAAAPRNEAPARARRRVAARSARLRVARHQRRLHGALHRTGAVLHRSQPEHAAHLRGELAAPQPGRRLDRGRLSARRGAGAADVGQRTGRSRRSSPNAFPTARPSRPGSARFPNAILGLLHDHRDLGLHTELISDGVMDLFESGALTGTRKVTRPGKLVATFALGTRRLYDFLHDNSAVEFLPVDWVNDPRVIGREHCFVSINATVEVDLLGPVQLRDDRRPLLLRQRRPDRLRARRDVQRGRHGLRRPALDDGRRIGLADRVPALSRARRSRR